MKHYIFKLKFETPVRFGSDTKGSGLNKVAMNCHADTLFSALCSEANLIGGQELVEKLATCVQENKLFLSDLFPYWNDDLYLPKPILVPNSRKISPEDLSYETAHKNSRERKTLKKLQFIAVKDFSTYQKWLAGNIKDHGLETAQFGRSELTQKVNIREEESLPYFVNTFSFNTNAGLYFIVGVHDDGVLTFLMDLLKSLGLSGIGGKKSVGYGKFYLLNKASDLAMARPNSDEKIIADMLQDSSANSQMTISACLPLADDISIVQEGTYLLIARNGFVHSNTYSKVQEKRNSVYMLNAGSCFPRRFNGDLLNLSAGGKHPIYRYGKGLFVGLDI